MVEPSPGPMLNIIRCCVKCGDVPVEVYGERKSTVCEKCGGERYGNCERITLIQAMFGLQNCAISPIQITDDAVSTTEAHSFEVWKEKGGFYGKIYVPVITWRQVANQFGGFDFVSIDAEGTSVALFQDMLLAKIFPHCVCVEFDDRLPELSQAMTAAGYHIVHSNGTNVVAAR
jgi:hypothetical protein